MERTKIEEVIKDLGLPGRVVEADRKLIKLDVFNSRLERFERLDLSHNEFCDLVLDWRQHRLGRETVVAARTALAQLPVSA